MARLGRREPFKPIINRLAIYFLAAKDVADAWEFRAYPGTEAARAKPVEPVAAVAVAEPAEAPAVALGAVLAQRAVQVVAEPNLAAIRAEAEAFARAQAAAALAALIAEEDELLLSGILAPPRLLYRIASGR